MFGQPPPPYYTKRRKPQGRAIDRVCARAQRATDCVLFLPRGCSEIVRDGCVGSSAKRSGCVVADQASVLVSSRLVDSLSPQLSSCFIIVQYIYGAWRLWVQVPPGAPVWYRYHAGDLRKIDPWDRSWRGGRCGTKLYNLTARRTSKPGQSGCRNRVARCPLSSHGSSNKAEQTRMMMPVNTRNPCSNIDTFAWFTSSSNRSTSGTQHILDSNYLTQLGLDMIETGW